MTCYMRLSLCALSVSQRGTCALVYPGDSVLVRVRAYMLGSGEPSNSSEMSVLFSFLVSIFSALSLACFDSQELPFLIHPSAQLSG